MNPDADPLAGLRDIQVPDPVPFWPPAPGWWLVLASLLIVGLFIFVYHRRRRGDPRRAALAELKRIEIAHRNSDDTNALVADLSTLLRRYALARFPAEDVAGLTGKAWLNFLDRTGGAGAFTKGPGRALTTAPYRPGEALEAGPLLALVENWVRRSAPSKAGTS